MVSKLKNCPLFYEMTEKDIKNCLAGSGANFVPYKKGEIIFKQIDKPVKMMVLVEGSVAICHDSIEGKRSIVAVFNQSGELFGEVFLFLNKNTYDQYAQAAADAIILQIPKVTFLSHTKLISNMLAILAQKTYFLNQKLQILSCATLRQKIAKFLLQNASAEGRIILTMNREELADFLNTARPSLSRELMHMQDDGFIRIGKKTIYITNINALQELVT